MKDLPVLMADTARVAGIRSALTTTAIAQVWYRQTGSGGHGAAPEGECHEVDLDVFLVLADRTVAAFTWERDGVVEGISVGYLADVPESGGSVGVRADTTGQWAPIMGRKVQNVVFAWQESDTDAPPSLFSTRIDFEGGASVAIALGEIGGNGEPRYFPDSLVVLFDESLARNYRPAWAMASAWGE
ncbi:hypothetical protein [Catenulispora pinisilvae]|uniref:hypothetical protein n=1 Tax=Catenulispora pinisilvae TaxID=2705253 RepID=UPI00189151E8|nr:hypothetical protein [Catenulispora pinisilvae]